MKDFNLINILKLACLHVFTYYTFIQLTMYPFCIFSYLIIFKQSSMFFREMFSYYIDLSSYNFVLRASLQ
jgi:hypothetical protein